MIGILTDYDHLGVVERRGIEGGENLGARGIDRHGRVGIVYLTRSVRALKYGRSNWSARCRFQPGSILTSIGGMKFLLVIVQSSEKMLNFANEKSP